MTDTESTQRNTETELADEALLARSMGEPSLFSVLYDRYHDEFLRKAARIVGDESAEDLVQETFVKIYLNAGRFKVQEGASFRSWGYKILVNTCFSFYKKQKRHTEAVAPLDPEFAELLPGFQTRDHDREFTRDYVMSVLSRMPNLLGNVLKLYFIDGKPQKEIADAAGVSVGVIKTRVHRAKKEFKRIATSFV